MAFLFVVENNIAKPNTETLLISPFKEIWVRDSSKDKSVAISEFTFIELFTSKKKSNPYSGYNDSEREEKLKQLLKFKSDWKPDKLIKEAINKLIEFHIEASPSYQYYIDNLEAAEKTRRFLKDIDLAEKNPKTGNPLYKPKDVTSAIADSERVIQTLHTLKERVEQELFESVKVRGGKTVNYFEQ